MSVTTEEGHTRLLYAVMCFPTSEAPLVSSRPTADGLVGPARVYGTRYPSLLARRTGSVPSQVAQVRDTDSHRFNRSSWRSTTSV
jgi:hypothetical protein